MKKIVIVGGGISGLSAAYFLEKYARKNNISCQIQLLEAQDRLGGALKTEMTGGFVLEQGAESFLSEKPWALQLCRELGLENEVISTRPENRRSFVVKNAKLIPVPEGFYLTAPSNLTAFLASGLVSPLGKMRALADFVMPQRYSAQDESVGGFIKRRFGREIYERIGQAMIGGVYSGDPDKLSLLATFPRFRELEGQYRSVIRGLRARKREESHEEASGPRYSLFLSLKNGMESLPHALRAHLKQTQVRLSCAVRNLEYKNNWKIKLQDGESLDADAVCLSLPAYQSAKLLAGTASELSALLSQIRYESAVTINLAFDEKEIPALPRGFGFVVPAAEKLKTIGCTFSGMKYAGRAPQGKILLRVFAGGWLDPGAADKSDTILIQNALMDLKTLLRIEAKPQLALVSRYSNSMPQYETGHFSRVEKIERQTKLIPGLYLAGNAYRGIGIPDCIRESEKTALAILA